MLGTQLVVHVALPHTHHVSLMPKSGPSLLHVMQVNNREAGDLNKPLSFGDFVEVVPNESAQPYGHHAVHSDCGSFLHPKPQMGGPKHRPPVEQQRQQLNSLYRLHSDTQHSPTDTWRVSSTELTTPPQRRGAEARRPVPSG